MEPLAYYILAALLAVMDVLLFIIAARLLVLDEINTELYKLKLRVDDALEELRRIREALAREDEKSPGEG